MWHSVSLCVIVNHRVSPNALLSIVFIITFSLFGHICACSICPFEIRRNKPRKRQLILHLFLQRRGDRWLCGIPLVVCVAVPVVSFFLSFSLSLSLSPLATLPLAWMCALLRACPDGLIVVLFLSIYPPSPPPPHVLSTLHWLFRFTMTAVSPSNFGLRSWEVRLLLIDSSICVPHLPPPSLGSEMAHHLFRLRFMMRLIIAQNVAKI